MATSREPREGLFAGAGLRVIATPQNVKFEAIALVVVIAFALYSVGYGFLGRRAAATIDGAVALTVFALVMVARRDGSERVYRAAITLSGVASLLGLGAVSLVSGDHAAACWFLVCVPLAMAYLGSARGAAWWAAAAATVQMAVALSPRVVSLESYYPYGALETGVNQLCVTAIILGMAVTWRRMADAYEKEVGLKERRILEQSNDLRLQAYELRVARDEALAAVQAREQFLANVSHEIRTPLNGVIGMANLLLQTGPLTERQREIGATIDRSGKLLLSLVNGILDYSKFLAGTVELERLPVDVRACVEEIVALFRAGERSAAVALRVEVDAAVPAFVTGDRQRLQQVLLNLVGNALKFTVEGEVAVSVGWTEPDRLVIAVHDTGIGIPADRLDRLFKPFSQVDASTTRRFGGTGLGLVISRHLVEAMDGDIGVESAEGKGSTFCFTVRAPRCEAADLVTASDLPPPDAGFASRTPLRILVAEDNPVNRDVAESYLKLLGYAPQLVENGRLALEAVSREPFDVVLMDLHMPEMDGLEATRRIRAEVPAAAQPWIIALTASVLAQEREHMRVAGVNAFVGKPFLPADLAAAFSECAAARHLQPSAPEPAPRRSPTGRLAQLREIYDRTPGGFKVLLDKFTETSDALMARIEEAMAAGNVGELQRAAHSLKSSSAMLECMETSRLSAAMETLAEGADLEGARQQLAGLKAALQGEREALQSAPC